MKFQLRNFLSNAYANRQKIVWNLVWTVLWFILLFGGTGLWFSFFFTLEAIGLWGGIAGTSTLSDWMVSNWGLLHMIVGTIAIGETIITGLCVHWWMVDRDQKKKFAMIYGQRTEIVPGIAQTTYKWIGSTHALLKVDPHLFGKLPYKLGLVKRDWFSFTDYYARQDGSNYLSYLYWQIRFRAEGFLSYAKYRIILGLEVKGIGYTPCGDIPQWRDLLK